MQGAEQELCSQSRTRRTTGARGQGLRCLVTEELCKESCPAPVHRVPGLVVLQQELKLMISIKKRKEQ